MTARRFAEDTKVPVGQTQTEIKARLRAAGAVEIAIFERSTGDAVLFKLGTCAYRVTIPLDPKSRDPGQDTRRAWRLMGLLIKAKLEAIREGATTVEREFLADMMMRDGHTVAEWALPQIEAAYAAGRMPTSLLLEGPK